MTAPDVRTPGGNRANAEDQNTNQHRNSATAAQAPQTAQHAQFERSRDTLAQRGIGLLANGAGEYTIQRGRRTQDLTGLNSVERFARLLGAAL